jgi:hypothetical protein
LALPLNTPMPKTSNGYITTSGFSSRRSIESSPDPTKSVRASFDGGSLSNGLNTGAGNVPRGINLDINYET